jgi:hypothetical protein
MKKRIGVVGYSGAKFDVEMGKALVNMALSIQTKNVKDEDIEIVSGLTSLGIPKLAYEFASKNGWKTVGVACKKAEEYECFNVDEKVIVGDEWGDESEKFLNSVDVIVRVGGGKQSIKEIETAKKMGIKCFEYDLPEDKG